MCMGTLVRWLVHWYTGLLVHWFTGSLVHWFTGSLFTGTLVQALGHGGARDARTG